MAFEALLEEYEKRRAKALAMGGAEKLARRRKAGTLNARERIERLFDPGTFLESGLFGASGVYPEEAEETLTDGKIAGYGQGRRAATSPR
jgi:acetyl-CoA carboxylase carboxyltransferase component